MFKYAMEASNEKFYQLQVWCLFFQVRAQTHERCTFILTLQLDITLTNAGNLIELQYNKTHYGTCFNHSNDDFIANLFPVHSTTVYNLL